MYGRLEKMKLSFVIPAYNEEEHLPACLESVQSEISRSPLGAYEVVVVNNASTDRTKEIAEGFQNVRVVYESIKGLVQARKAGFVATTGDLVANIDADTILPKGWLHIVMREFQKDSKLVALSGPFVLHDLSLRHRALARVWYFFGVLVGFRIQGGNFIIRRDAWERAGGFDTSIEFYGEDADVGRRIRKQGKVRWLWKLYVYSSGRRLRGEGTVKTAFLYALNFFWIHVTGKPFSQKYKDIRPAR